MSAIKVTRVGWGVKGREKSGEWVGTS